MFNFDSLSGVGKTLKTFAAELQGQRISIENLKQKRESIRYAPLPLGDVANALDAWVGRLEQRYAAELKQTIGFLHMSAAIAGDTAEIDSRLRGRGLVTGGPQGQTHPTDIDMLLAGLFGAQLRASLREKVAAWTPLSGTGMPLDQRAGAIAEIDAQLAKLEASEAKLVKSARAAGLAVD